MPLPPRFQRGKLLSELSTFGIGGEARYFLAVHSILELQEALRYCFSEKLPFHIIGKGSNSLFHDLGLEGVAILNKISFCEQEGPSFYVGAGYSFSLLGAQTARKGWSGLEFASGIPASVGGAVYMNAGANGAEVCNTLQEVTYVTEQGELQILPKEELVFRYRFSSFQQKKGAIAAARFLLTPSSEARGKQLKIIEYRTQTQPYGDKSAGCVFRNPEKGSAGALIEQSGLKGLSIGGAEVSHLHANFIINKGGAQAQEVLELAALVREKVKEKTGIELEMEIRVIPHVPR